MKDRRIKTYWWKSIHQYKGEGISPYEPLSHLLPWTLFPSPSRGEGEGVFFSVTSEYIYQESRVFEVSVVFAFCPSSFIFQPAAGMEDAFHPP